MQNIFLKMLQIRDGDETDDDHQEPRGHLLRRDDIPHMYLIGILPRARKRADIFGNPDEKRDQDKPEIERHPSFFREHR